MSTSNGETSQETKDDVSKRRGKRVAKACDRCHLQHQPCDNAGPVCSTCKQAGTPDECTYTRQTRRRGPAPGIKRVTKACDRCHLQHQPCDNRKPICTTCEQAGSPSECTYDREAKKRGPAPGASDRIADRLLGALLERRPDIIEDIIDVLETPDGQEVLHLARNPFEKARLVSMWANSDLCHALRDTQGGLGGASVTLQGAATQKNTGAAKRSHDDYLDGDEDQSLNASDRSSGNHKQSPIDHAEHTLSLLSGREQPRHGVDSGVAMKDDAISTHATKTTPTGKHALEAITEDPTDFVLVDRLWAHTDRNQTLVNLGFNPSDGMDAEFQTLCYPESTIPNASNPQDGIEPEEDVWRRLVMRGPY